MASGKITNKNIISGSISSGNSLNASVTAGSGTTDHNRLTNRNKVDQHPVEAITGLREELNSKLDANTAAPLINEAITTKAAGLYYDAKKEFARKSYWYLTSKIDEVTGLGIPGDKKEYIISGPYDLGMGGGTGGAGGGGVTNISVKQVDWPAAAAVGNTSTSTKIKINWSSTIGEDKTPTGSGTIYLLVNSKQVEVLPKQAQGDIILDVSKYLVSGENKIEVRVLDTYGTTGLTIGTINGISLTLKSEFNSDIPYRGRINYTYIPVGNVEKKVHFIVDGREVATQTVTASGVEQTYSIRNLSHGSHTLKVYFEAKIGSEWLPSNILFYEIIFVEEGNATPIIASNFNELRQSQYVSFKIPYRVFIEGLNMTTVTLKANGNVVSKETVTTAGVHSWVYRADTPTIDINDQNEETRLEDPLILEIICGDVVKKFEIDIIKSKISVSPELKGLELALSAYGRSNGDTANRNVWTYTTDDEVEPITYSCTFNNFNWSSDGWLLDEKDTNILRVGGNARLEIPIKVFEKEIKATGKTIELEIATRDIRDYSTTIISCLDNTKLPFYEVEVLHTEEDTRKNGFKVSYNYSYLKDSGLSVGRHLFTYDGNGWKLNDQTDYSNLANYGISLESTILNIDGTDLGNKPLVGDRILVNYSLEARGFEITPQVASIRSQQSLLSTQYKEDEHIRIAFVVESNAQNRIIWMYINGVASGAMQYPLDDTFVQDSPSFITIGSSDATVDIYNIRIYKSALISKQLVNNWIADTADMSLKAQRFNHNNIVDENNNITIESLSGSGHSELPYIIWGMDELPKSKDDDVFKSGTSARYVDPTDSTRNFTAVDCEYKIQGTSSSVYPVKNIRMRTKKGKGGPNLEWYDDDGNDLIIGNGGPGFPITTPNGIGVDYFTFKVDYASSEGANNVELTKLYNDASIKYGLLTPPQYAQYKVNKDTNDITVRVGIDGFPVAAFHESKDGISFLTKANFNNDKANPDVYGFEDGDESWETTNNSAAETKYQKPVTVDNFENGFEIRFPDEDGYNDMSKLGPMTAWVYSTYRDNTRVVTDLNTAVTIPYEDVVITDNTQENISFRYNTEIKDEVEKIVSITFTKDTNDYRLSKFKHELKDWFNVDSCLFYYLFTELFLMIDSRAKNAFPTYFKSRNEGDGGDRWFWIPYDMDTAIGIDNKGKLSFDYYLEDIDQLDGADVYNGQTSVMWCNIRDAFKAELASMYSTLRVQGLISYDTVESRFTEHQGKWPEVLLNQDAANKYVVPLTKGDNYLEMLQGTKEQQRKWWLYNRFKYMDSKYNAGDSKADFVQFRAYVDMGEEKPDIEITPYANIYATASFGNGSKYLIRERITDRGSKAVLKNPFSIMDDENDQETYIYSASQLKSIGDISPFHPDTVKIGNAIRLQELKVGDDGTKYPGYTNPHLKELTVGANTLLRKIDARNCINLGTGTTVSPDLSGCTNIEEIYFTGTKIKGITLPDGGTIKKLHLPGTLKSLKIQNQPSLTDLVIENTNTTINKGITVSEEQAYLFAGIVIKKDPWNEITTNADIYIADSAESTVNTTDCIRINIASKELYDSLVEKETLLNVRSAQLDARYDLFENDKISLVEYSARFTTFPAIEAVGRGVEIKTLINAIKESIKTPELSEFKESLIESLWLENIPSKAIQAREFIKNMRAGSGVRLIGINETFEDTIREDGTTYKAWEQIRDYYNLLDTFKGVDVYGTGEISEKPQVTGVINIDKISYKNYIELTNRYPEITINAKQIWCSINFYTKISDQNTDRKEVLYASISTPLFTELDENKKLIIKGKRLFAPLNPEEYKSIAKVYTFANWRLQKATYSSIDGWQELKMLSKDEELRLPIWTEDILINSDARIDAQYSDQPRKYSVTFETGSNIIELAEGFNKKIEVDYNTLIPQEPELIWKTDPDLSDDQILPSEVKFEGWFTEAGKRWNFGQDSVQNNITLTAIWTDSQKPSIIVSQKAYNIFTCNAFDNLGITRWAVVKDSIAEPTSWTFIDPTTELEQDYPISSAGEYYFWVADSNDNKVSAKIVAYNINVTTTAGITADHYYFMEEGTEFNTTFALEGTILTIIVNPDEHYENLSIKIPVELIDSTTFKVLQDVNISLTCTPKKYIVTFITGNESLGIKVESQVITYNTLATKPLALYYNGYIITNWYTETEDTITYWDFENHLVEEDITLHAEWQEYHEPTVIKIKIPHSFDTWEDAPIKPIEPTKPNDPTAPDYDLKYAEYESKLAEYESKLVEYNKIKNSYDGYKIKVNYTQTKSKSVQISFGDQEENGVEKRFESDSISPTVSSIEHTYTAAGEYEIKIYGTVSGYSLGGGYTDQVVDPACCIQDVNFAWDITATGDYAFKGAQIKSLSLTPYMTRIARAAFAACKQLTTINIPSSISEIGSQAFEGCTALKNYVDSDENLTDTILIPRTISTVGNSVFANCSAMSKLVFEGDEDNPGRLKVIGNNFANNSGIKELIIPKFITHINSDAFGNCGSLEKVVLLNPNLIVGEKTFNSTVKLNSAGPINWELGAGNNNDYDIEYAWTKVIPDYAFSAGTNFMQSYLYSVDLPNNIEVIGTAAFRGANIKQINFPASLKEIGEEAFYYTGLLSLDVPDTVTTIKARAFGSNTSLSNTGVILRLGGSTETVTVPGNSWFLGCKAELTPAIPSTLLTIETIDGVDNARWVTQYGPHWHVYEYDSTTGRIAKLELIGINN